MLKNELIQKILDEKKTSLNKTSLNKMKKAELQAILDESTQKVVEPPPQPIPQPVPQTSAPPEPEKKLTKKQIKEMSKPVKQPKQQIVRNELAKIIVPEPKPVEVVEHVPQPVKKERKIRLLDFSDDEQDINVEFVPPVVQEPQKVEPVIQKPKEPETPQNSFVQDVPKEVGREMSQTLENQPVNQPEIKQHLDHPSTLKFQKSNNKKPTVASIKKEIKILCEEFHSLAKQDITEFKKKSISADELINRYNELRLEAEDKINFMLVDCKTTDSLVDYVESLLDITRAKISLALEN
jgi:hypothetical protein